jgi:hypothetical protein
MFARIRSGAFRQRIRAHLRLLANRGLIHCADDFVAHHKAPVDRNWVSSFRR